MSFLLACQRIQTKQQLSNIRSDKGLYFDLRQESGLFVKNSSIKKIIEYSTIPGTSRHHWGTDLDIVDAAVPQPQSLLEAANFEGNGPFCKLKEWLNTHAESFGFYEVYTNNPNRKGFKYEPWHFSYAPVSVGYLKAYRTLKFSKILSQSNLLGSAYFSEQFISKYYNENILDINPALL